MEKLKDFFYDYSDVFLALLIVAVMFSVVYVNLNTIFDDTTVAVAQPSDSSPAPVTPQTDPVVIDIDLSSDPGPEDARQEPGSEPSAPGQETPPPPAPQPAAGELVTVTIPNGTPGIGIARILVEHQLMPDTDAFVAAAETLELSLKLKSGTFQIPAGSTPEEMVLIIAGQR